MVGSSMVGKIGRALVDENPLAARVGRAGGAGIRSMYRHRSRIWAECAGQWRRRVLSADHGRLTLPLQNVQRWRKRDMLMLCNNSTRRGQAPGAPGAP